MKKQMLARVLGTIATIAALTSISVAAQDSVSTTVTTDSQTAPALSYGAANVLKLARAKIGDETILAYIRKSGQGYGALGASEIIYLHEQGVSDRIVTTMLEQEKKTRDALVAQQAAAQQTLAAAAPSFTTAAPVAAAPQYQQTYVQPPVTYVQAAPAPLIVMQDSSPRLVDYGIYPSYGYPRYGYGGYGYSYPAVSFSFGYGSSYCGSSHYSSGHYSSGHYNSYHHSGSSYSSGHHR